MLIIFTYGENYAMAALIPYAATEIASNPVVASAAADLGTAALKGAFNLFTKGTKRKAAPRQSKFKQAKRAKKKDNMRALDDLGRPAGHSESKRNDRQQAVAALNNKQFQSVDLIRVEKDVAANENITKRSRDTLLHKGCKVCFTCKNTRKETVFLNWAIVVPKAINSVSNLDILRGDDIERETAVDVNQTFLDLRCLPINRDRYMIVKHRRHTILPDPDKGTGNAEGRDFAIIEEYIKTNRQIFFDGDTAVPLQNLFMVWWVDYYNSPTGVSTATADVSYKIVNYFKEVN